VSNDKGSPSSADGRCYRKNGNSVSTRQSVFEKLDENPLLTAKVLCRLLDLPYSKYWNYVGRLRCEWKYYHRNEHGSKCSIHACRGWCYLPECVDRARALGAVGFVVGLGIVGCCGRIVWVGFSGLRLVGLTCMFVGLLILGGLISLFVTGLVLRV
jgi:hypothetical protein